MLGVVGMLVAIRLWPEGKTSPAGGAGSGAPAQATSTLTVRAYVVAPQSLDETVTVTGSLLANKEVALAAEGSGRVLQIFFKEGARVSAGQLLVQLNDAELKAQLDQAQTRLELVKAQEYRQRVLLQKEAVSQEEYDVAAAEVKTQQAAMELIDAQLRRLQIRAPFNGVIGLRQVDEGAYVQAGTVVATLQNLDVIKLDFSVPERYLGQVGVGKRIYFRTRASQRRYEGTVYALEPKIDAETRSLTLRAQAVNVGGTLLPGAFAEVELVLSHQDRALLIPTEAVVADKGVQRVYVLERGKATLRDITTGVRTTQQLEVQQGLSAGDTVLTSGILQLKPGQAVKVTAIDAPAAS